MKVQLNPIFTDLSGQQNKVVFSKNHYGTYSKKWYAPSQTPSTFNDDSKNRFALFNSNWNNLTDTQRQQWFEFSKQITKTNFNGNKYNPIPKNLYVSCNCNLSLIGRPPIDQPKPIEYFPIAYNPHLFVNFVTSKLEISFDVSPGSGNSTNLFFLTRNLSPGINYVSSQLRFCNYRNFGINPYLMTFATFNHRYGEIPASGNKIFVKIQTINNINGLAAISSLSFAIA